MKERSPNGLGVISAQVNWGAAVAGASVAVQGGAAGGEHHGCDHQKAQNKKQTFLHLFFSYSLIGLRKFIDRFMNMLRHHLLNLKIWNPCIEPLGSGTFIRILNS